MQIKLIACTLLLQLMLLAPQAQAQSPISLDTGAAPGFDYDAALALTMEALGGTVLRGRGVVEHN